MGFDKIVPSFYKKPLENREFFVVSYNLGWQKFLTQIPEMSKDLSTIFGVGLFSDIFEPSQLTVQKTNLFLLFLTKNKTKLCCCNYLSLKR